MIEKKSNKPGLGEGNPHMRTKEKRDKIILFLAEYQYSTISIMSQYLGLSSVGQWPFFNRLIKVGLVYKTNVATIKEKVFLLTREGGELAGILADGEKINYLTDEKRIRIGTCLHDLCVQLAVIKRLKPDMKHNFERQLYFTDRDKLPDALLTLNGRSTALEIELSHKNTNRIYRAFFDHIKAMQEKYYYDVEYVFFSETLCQNYLKKFNQKEWPIVERADGRLRQTGKLFEPDTVDGLKDRFSFVVQEFEILGG